MTLRLANICVLCASLLCSVSAAAQERPTDEADPERRAQVHFEQGMALFDEDSYEAALVEFEASFDLYPAPRILYNIGITQRVLRRYADAIDTFRRYLVEVRGESEERLGAVRQVVAELEALLGTVLITTDPVGVDVLIDGELEGTTPLGHSVSLPAGEHDLELLLDGYVTRRETIEVRSRSESAHHFELSRESVPVYRQWWLWTTVGIVAAGVVLAIVLPLTIEPDEADFGEIRLVRE